MKLFASYPQVVQMDCQANVNQKTDGFIVVGICGNYHNVTVLKSFVGSQKSETFRWILLTAFPFLVLNCARIRTILTDGCQALIGEIRAECHPGGMFPQAIMLRCIFHFLIDAFDREFGYGMQTPWFQYVKKGLFRLRACESREEFEDCREFVLRTCAGFDVPEFPKRSVIKFIMSRLANPEDWVLFAHVSCETRGCQSTQACESEQGHSRNTGVNARCSFLVTIIRYERLLTCRMKKLLRWVNRQLDGTLARGVTNESESTLSIALLKRLDAEMLPWMLDTVEEQMLLGRGDLRCVYTASNGSRHTFSVWYEGEKHDTDDAHKLQTAVHGAGSSDDENGDVSGDGGDYGDDGHEEPKRRKIDSHDENWTDEIEAELDQILSNPVSVETEFMFRKVRRVVAMVDPKDASNVLLSCSCGYHKRIGVACRHIWCLLFTILKAVPVLLEGTHRVRSMCNCVQKPTTCPTCMESPHYSKFDWEQFPTFDFFKMVNMDVGNKVKYHAILHTHAPTENLFPVIHSTVFYPRIPASLFRKFLEDNDPEGMDRVPTSGLPLNNDQQDNPDHDDRDQGVSGASKIRHSSDRTHRQEVPTYARVFNKLEAIWDRTQRLKKDACNSTKSLILTTLNSLEEQILSQHPDLQPKRTRDKYLGIARK